MSRYALQKLPQNFRYFLSLKEIKEMEIQMGCRFARIVTGPIAASEHFDQERRLQSSFRALTINAKAADGGWDFHIRQDGFRSELLPDALNAEVKHKVVDGVIAYISKVHNALPTDGFITPSGWVHVMIIGSKPKISFHEEKKS